MKNHLYLAFAFLTACGSAPTEKTPTPPKDDTQPIKEIADTPREPVEEKKKLQPVTDDQVRALIAQWQKAQLDMDFSTYETLYGTKFSGVKRVGASTYRYQRKGWLKDRKRMFQKPVQVDVDGLRIVNAANVITATFTQTWNSGTYKDVGPKELVLVMEEGQLRIVREEMLKSILLDPNGADVFTTEKSYHYFYGENLLHIGDVALKGLDLGVLESFNNGLVMREVKPASLPENFHAMIGTKLVGYGAGGGECKGTITGFAVASNYIPFTEQFMMWEMDEPDLDVNQFIWETGAESGNGLLLAIVSDCDAAMIAVSSAIPETQRYDPILVEPSDLDLIYDEYQRLPEYQDIQMEYMGDPEFTNGTEWTEFEGEKREDGVVGAWTNGQTTFVIFGYMVGTCCGDFCADLYTIWEVESGNPLKYHGGYSQIGDWLGQPTVILDTDGDGVPEFFTEYDALTSEGDQWNISELRVIPGYACGC